MANSLVSETTGACLASNMKLLRKELSLSQEQLSERSGVPRSTIASLERGEGNPTLQVLMGIAQGLGVAIAELLAQRQPRATLFPKDEHTRMSYPPSVRKSVFPRDLLKHFGSLRRRLVILLLKRLFSKEQNSSLRLPMPQEQKSISFWWKVAVRLKSRERFSPSLKAIYCDLTATKSIPTAVQSWGKGARVCRSCTNSSRVNMRHLRVVWINAAS